MTQNANQHHQSIGLFPLSHHSQSWENIRVEQFHHAAGEANCCFKDEHTICLSLSSRPVRLMQIQGGKAYSGLYSKGDISVTPADVPLFARWDSEDHYLQIQIASQFLRDVAGETIDKNPDQLELLTEFRTRDSEIEAIGRLLLTDMQQKNVGSSLYIQSLTNVLAVHLIRNYSTNEPHISSYGGGLSERQLLKVFDYIHAHLNQEVKLADLSNVLNMSQFHFSHLFKQSMGIAPYQYLLQQRIERAKQLLKCTDQSIVEIAFCCGFNSHSHLSKQFRQVVGMTPKAYRES